MNSDSMSIICPVGWKYSIDTGKISMSGQTSSNRQQCLILVSQLDDCEITIAAGISTFANLAISGLSFFRATNYFMQQGRSIPDGLVITGFYSGATRGVAYGAGINLYLSLNPPGLYLYCPSQKV